MPLFFLLSADASVLSRRFSCHKEDPSHSSPDRNTTVSLFLQRRNIIIGTNPPRISRSRPYSFSKRPPETETPSQTLLRGVYFLEPASLARTKAEEEGKKTATLVLWRR
jgi:hypothetical protein